MTSTRRPWIMITAFVLVLGLLPSVNAFGADAEYVNKMRTAARYLAQGIPDAAAKVLEQVLAKHPGDARASVTYVDALIQMRRLDDADAFLEQAFVRVDEKPDLYQARVKLRRAQGRDRDAFDDVIRVMETDPERATWAFRETKDQLENGLDSEHALRVTDTAREAHPADLQFMVLTAVVVTIAEERVEDALRLMIRFDEEYRRDGEAILRFAQEMQAMGEEEVALEGMLASVERATKATKRSYVLDMIAHIQERQGKYEDALASLEMIATERKGTTASGNALLRSAEIHQRYLDDPESALLVYDKIQNDPILGHHRPRMLLQMADCYVRLGRFDEASAKYHEVLPEALDPEQAEKAHLQLAEVEFYRGNVDTALVLFQDMAEAYPRSLFSDQAAARYIMLNKYRGVAGGEALKVWGRMEWARLLGDSVTVDASANSLIQMHPEGELSAEALLALAEIANVGGNYIGALGYLETLVTDHPTDRRAAEALMRQGSILQARLGRPQEALMRYETVLTDYPRSVQAGDARRFVEVLRRELKS
jgi:tetratricopeptide (TPR) repeat protein